MSCWISSPNNASSNCWKRNNRPWEDASSLALPSRRKGLRAMMARFCRYVDKVFQFGQRLKTLHDCRQQPVIPTCAVFATTWTLFATARGSLNSIEKEVRIPARLRGLVGPHPPSADTIGRVYKQMDSEPLRQM